MATGALPAPPPRPKEVRRDSGEVTPAPGSKPPGPQIIKRIDACGLQCPGPIQQLKAALDGIAVGQAVAIEATDPGFRSDLPAWCHTTGHELVELSPAGRGFRAVVVKTAAASAPSTTGAAAAGHNMTVVVFSSDFDRAMAAFVIANGAATMGFKPTLFFTFWGLNVLRKESPALVRKTPIERMFGWMMPRGPEKLALSKMHMLGMGRAMIKGIMRKKRVASLPELIQGAQQAGVKLVACTMSMDLMGIKKEELIDGVEEGGVAMYLDRAGGGTVNLFI